MVQPITTQIRYIGAGWADTRAYSDYVMLNNNVVGLTSRVSAVEVSHGHLGDDAEQKLAEIIKTDNVRPSVYTPADGEGVAFVNTGGGVNTNIPSAFADSVASSTHNRLGVVYVKVSNPRVHGLAVATRNPDGDISILEEVADMFALPNDVYKIGIGTNTRTNSTIPANAEIILVWTDFTLALSGKFKLHLATPEGVDLSQLNADTARNTDIVQRLTPTTVQQDEPIVFVLDIANPSAELTEYTITSATQSLWIKVPTTLGNHPVIFTANGTTINDGGRDRGENIGGHSYFHYNLTGLTTGQTLQVHYTTGKKSLAVIDMAKSALSKVQGISAVITEAITSLAQSTILNNATTQSMWVKTDFANSLTGTTLRNTFISAAPTYFTGSGVFTSVLGKFNPAGADNANYLMIARTEGGTREPVVEKKNGDWVVNYYTQPQRETDDIGFGNLFSSQHLNLREGFGRINTSQVDKTETSQVNYKIVVDRGDGSVNTYHLIINTTSTDPTSFNIPVHFPIDSVGGVEVPTDANYVLTFTPAVDGNNVSWGIVGAPDSTINQHRTSGNLQFQSFTITGQYQNDLTSIPPVKHTTNAGRGDQPFVFYYNLVARKLFFEGSYGFGDIDLIGYSIRVQDAIISNVELTSVTIQPPENLETSLTDIRRIYPHANEDYLGLYRLQETHQKQITIPMHLRAYDAEGNVVGIGGGGGGYTVTRLNTPNPIIGQTASSDINFAAGTKEISLTIQDNAQTPSEIFMYRFFVEDIPVNQSRQVQFDGYGSDITIWRASTTAIRITSGVRAPSSNEPEIIIARGITY